MMTTGHPFPDSLAGEFIFFIGVGGVSMASLCRLALHDGATVAGSDRTEGEGVRVLRELGVRVLLTEEAWALPEGVTAVVYTLAVAGDHPQLLAARARGIPCFSRPAFLGWYMHRFGERIGVSGTHGKSTTTAMLHAVFSAAHRQPTTLCGTSARTAEACCIGGREVLIFEGCEYRDAFLSFVPTTLVLLNVEWDHPDYFRDEGALRASFRTAAESAHRVVLNLDDPLLSSIAEQGRVRAVTFGRGASADLRYRTEPIGRGCYALHVDFLGEPLGRVPLCVAGEFQAVNAAAALTAALVHGIPFATASHALGAFRGLGRRMECIKRTERLCVYYDYAHHPTELRAAIRALREREGGPVTAVFRPHTYSRTAALWNDFCHALGEADRVLITDVYAAREADLLGVSAEELARAIGERAHYVPLAELPSVVARENGCVGLFGAGDLDEVLTAVRSL